MELISPRVGAFRRAARDEPDTFWGKAAEALPWHRRWDRVFEWEPDQPDERAGYFRWFTRSKEPRPTRQGSAPALTCRIFGAGA